MAAGEWSGTLNPETLVSIWQRAYRIRQVELEIVKRYYPNPADHSQSPMKTPTHLSIGQEVLASTVREVVGPDSHCYSTHRAHAHYLAWGGDLNAMVAELYGKATGCARGWGGSMHLRDASVGFMGGSPIVGSGLSIAVGDAFAAKLRGDDRVTVAFVGDAVLETGQFWESLTFARLHNLNLLIVVEDNGLSTATRKPVRQPEKWHAGFSPEEHRLVDRQAFTAFNDLSSIFSTINTRPLVIRFFTTRFYEHVGVGRDDWRDVPELDTDADALHVLTGMLPADYDPKPWKTRVASEVSRAFANAEAAEWTTV